MTPNPAAPAPTRRRDSFLLGARLCLPVGLSVFVFGLVWGMLAGQAGMTGFEVFLTSALVFAGSAQFVALDIWIPQRLDVFALVAAVLIINLRYLLMTASLRPLLAPWPGPLALLATFFVTDENWAVTMGEVRTGRASAFFLLGGGVLIYVLWVLASLIGRAGGAFIADPEAYGLDFAFTATFLALLLGMVRGRADIVPLLVAGAVATLAALFVPDKWYILIGGLAGSFAGAALASRRSAP